MPRELTGLRPREHRPRRQASAPSIAGSPAAHETGRLLLDLQRTAGNQAVNQLLHRRQAPWRSEASTQVGILAVVQRAPEAPPEAQEKGTTETTALWDEVSGACTSLFQQLGSHRTPNSDWVGKLDVIWQQVGAPGAKSAAELKKLLGDLDDLKKQITEEARMARESWKTDDAYCQQERKALAAMSEEWSKDALKILNQQYAETAHVVQIAGDYLTLDDLTPLEFMLRDNKHRQHAQERARRIQEGPNGPAESPGSADRGGADAGDLALPAGLEATDEAALRELYVQGSKAIQDEARLMISKGADATEVADWAVAARNNLKARIRNRGLRIIKVIAEARNRAKYKDPLGKSAEEMRTEGRTNAEIIEKVAETSPKVTKWAGRLRIAGRITIAVDLGMSVYRIATASDVDRPRVLLEEAGRVGGTLAGAEGGALVGGGIGESIGEWFGPEGAVIGGAVGGIIGGIAGAISGGWAGRKLAGFVANELYPPEATGFEGNYEAGEVVSH